MIEKSVRIYCFQSEVSLGVLPMMAEVLKLKDTSMMSLEITVCKSLYLSIIVLGIGPKNIYSITDCLYNIAND